MSEPLSPSIVKGAGRKELPAYLSNGVVGLRVRDNPLAAGMALLCGFSGLHPEKKIEAAAVAPYPLAGNLAINGVWLSDVPHQVTVVDQAYDFSCGEITSHIRFTPQGWARGPVVLPQGWKSIEVERLWLRGRPARLVAAQGKAAKITFS